MRGRILTRGSTVTVYALTFESAYGRTRVVKASTVVAENARMVLEELSEELTRTVFGQVEDKVVRGLCLPELAIEAEHRVVVEAGFQAGRVFRVVDVIRYDRVPHIEAAMVATTETLPIPEPEPDEPEDPEDPEEPEEP